MASHQWNERIADIERRILPLGRQEEIFRITILVKPVTSCARRVFRITSSAVKLEKPETGGIVDVEPACCQLLKCDAPFLRQMKVLRSRSEAEIAVRRQQA